MFTGAQERAACDRVLKMARAPSSRRGGARIGRTYLVAGGRVRGGSRRGAGRGDTRGRRGHGLAQRDGQLLALREHLGGDAHLRTARPRRRSRGPRETETRVEPTENALDESARGASATRVSVKGVERARAPVDVSSTLRRGSDEGRRVENDSSRLFLNHFHEFQTKLSVVSYFNTGRRSRRHENDIRPSDRVAPVTGC